MTAILDTNVLVRHLVRDQDDQARRASSILARGDEELILIATVLAEVVFVLESIYEQPRDAITLAALSLLALPSVVAPEARTLVDALRIYQSAHVHFVDAYVAAAARVTGVRRVMSFDMRLGRIEGVERIEP